MSSNASRLYERTFMPVIGPPCHSIEPHCEPINTRALDASLCEAQVAREAYKLAERRQFAPGHELEDWLLAEAIVAGRAAR